MIRKCVGIAALTSGALLLAASSFAESPGHGGHHTPSFADLTPYWVNFALYVFLMYSLLKNPVSKAWATRVETIAAQVNRGRIERDAAERLFAAATARRAGLPAEVQSLSEQIQQEGVTEASDLLKDARLRAQRVKDQGKDMVMAEGKALEVSLKKALAEEVLRKATEIIKGQMNVENDATMRAAAVRNISSLVH